MSQVRSNKVFNGTNAERLVLPTRELEATDAFRESDTGDEFEWSGVAWYQTGSAGASNSLEQGSEGGRNPDSVNNNYNAVHREMNGSGFLNPVTSVQTLGAGAPAFFAGLNITVALAGTLTIVGMTDIDGNAISWVLPIGSVGVQQPAGDFDIRCESGITAQLSAAADATNTGVDNNVFIGWRGI